MEIKFDDGSFFSMEMPTIRIKAYKLSGKWGYSKSTVLEDSELWIIERDSEFYNLIRKNHELVRKFCPVTSGFTGGYHFEIESYIPSKFNGYCGRLILATEFQ